MVALNCHPESYLRGWVGSINRGRLAGANSYGNAHRHSLARRPPHLPLSMPGRLMGHVRPIVGIPAGINVAVRSERFSFGLLWFHLGIDYPLEFAGVPGQ